VFSALGLLAAVGCKADTDAPASLPAADSVVATLVGALQAGNLSGVPLVGSQQDAQTEYQTVTTGLDGLKPTITPGQIRYDVAKNTATVDLATSYAIGPSSWAYTSQATLEYDGTLSWRVRWSPTIVYPQLDGYSRLLLTTTSPTRGEIMADDGTAMVWNRPVYQIGIDKSKVSGAQMDASAQQLATLVGVDPNSFVARVDAGGPQQFVVAITLRADQVPAGVENIPGALSMSGTASLGPSPTFAIGLLGTAGEATADQISASNGALQQGDIVGQSGLQAKYDDFLRGTDGYTVYLAPRSSASITTPPPTPRPTATPISQRVQLWTLPPTAGGKLYTTLDVAAQTKAESVLASQTGVAAMVVLDAKTGALLAAANSPASGANAYATQGRYAPGSTFKLATTLAAMRNGMTPDSTVDCPTTVTVNGKQFKNVTGYSTADNGMITMRQAVAYSCNTAMVNISQTLPSGALTDAAASLGIGNQADLGFYSFMGDVPNPTDPVTLAADSFGQGDVLASPLAMATEAASVAAGKTITPYLLVPPSQAPTASPDGTDSGPTTAPAASATPSGSPGATTATASSALPASEMPPTALPSSSAKPLTAQEAAWLQDEMQAVVAIGSGSVLKGLVIGAKSGTAEFQQDGQTLTHAWFIAYNDQYAIAAYVDQGVGGATTAAPLIKAFLS